MRLDVYLTQQGYFATRSKALQAIKEGHVFVNGIKPFKAGMEITEKDQVVVKSLTYQFVSRGGYKLLGAIQAFSLQFADKVVLDIGASTGGFTDCALQFGAKKVYAYDVGHDQLAPSLRNHPQVITKEGVNCRNLTKEDFDQSIDVIVMDVSFISCTKMFNSISQLLEKGKEAIVLFKPQFEVGTAYLNNNGIVHNQQKVLEKLQDTIQYAQSFDLGFMDYTLSPITGTDGNQEYLLYFKKAIANNPIILK